MPSKKVMDKLLDLSPFAEYKPLLEEKQVSDPIAYFDAGLKRFGDDLNKIQQVQQSMEGLIKNMASNFKL